VFMVELVCDRTPVDVTGYLCPLSANAYGIEFLEFRIREMEGERRELYNVKKPEDAVMMHPIPWLPAC